MGKKSNREHKTIYQVYREERGYTQASASEAMDYLISEDKIAKIEGGKTPYPEEVMIMAQCYRHPELRNYFCSKECEMGQKYVPEIKIKELPQIVLETIASLNALYKDKDRLIEIAVDGQISDDEKKDFERIRQQLINMSMTIESLQLWLMKTMVNSK